VRPNAGKKLLFSLFVFWDPIFLFFSLARLNYEKSWKKAKNLGKMLLSTKKSWPMKEKEKLGVFVFARSIGQDFFCKSLGPRPFQKKRDKV
jgi:hypothetical protein